MLLSQNKYDWELTMFILLTCIKVLEPKKLIRCKKCCSIVQVWFLWSPSWQSSVSNTRLVLASKFFRFLSKFFFSLAQKPFFWSIKFKNGFWCSLKFYWNSSLYALMYIGWSWTDTTESSELWILLWCKVFDVSVRYCMLSTDTDTSKTKHTHFHAMIRTLNFKPNVEFDFNVSVSNCMLSTDTSKLNLTLGTFIGICPGGF